MLAPEGRNLIAGTGLAAAGAIVLSLLFGGLAWALAVLAWAAFGFTLWFFRDPPRTVPAAAAQGDLILAPADGKVIEIVEEEEPLFVGGPARRLSIFLSPLNVHVNRTPCDGTVEHVRYVPGEYLVAWHPKASEKNERSEIGVRHPSGTPVLFKQIAGAVARRIVFYLKEGDAVRAGDRYGIVKFGSRMDVVVPPDVQFAVRPGQRTVAGETIIGRLPVAARVDGQGAIRENAGTAPARAAG